jgi:endo-1,4-beta-D-glucanase Y
MTTTVNFQRWWFFTQFHLLDEDLLPKVGVTVWSIWNQRNDRIWNNGASAEHWVVKAGLDFLQRWKTAQTTPLSSGSRQAPLHK